MRRRDLIAVLGGAAVWPIAAHAQSERMPRVGVLMAFSKNDPVAQEVSGRFRKRSAVSDGSKVTTSGSTAALPRVTQRSSRPMRQNWWACGRTQFSRARNRRPWRCDSKQQQHQSSSCWQSIPLGLA